MTKRYKLWHSTGARSVRVLWTLEELGAASTVDVVTVPFPPVVRQPDYLTINPLGSVPYFINGDVHLSESIAICQYVAAQCPPTSLVVPPDETHHAAYLQFLWFGEATLMQPIAVLVRQLLLTPEDSRSPTLIDGAQAALMLRQRALARALSGNGYLAADRFTLADISVGYALGLAARLGERPRFLPEVDAYFERVSTRPAYLRAHATRR